MPYAFNPLPDGSMRCLACPEDAFDRKSIVFYLCLLPSRSSPIVVVNVWIILILLLSPDNVMLVFVWLTLNLSIR